MLPSGLKYHGSSCTIVIAAPVSKQRKCVPQSVTLSYVEGMKWTAHNKMLDLLARRDHSEKELRTKLKKHFTEAEIEKAIEFAKNKKWIPDDETSAILLAERAASALHRKKKGILYINHFLGKKWLPKLKADPRLELEKARDLINNKKSKKKNVDNKVMARFLLSRGFEMTTVRKAIHEEL